MISQKKAREWLVTSSLTALWLALLWSAKTLAFDAPDPAFRRSLSEGTDAVPFGLIDTLVERMTARSARLRTTGGRAPSSVTQSTSSPQADSSPVLAFIAEIREDSSELAGALSFVTREEDRAFVSALLAVLTAERRKLESRSESPRVSKALARPTNADSVSSLDEEHALALLSFMRTIDSYQRARRERMEAAFDAHQREARPYLAAAALFALCLASLGYLVFKAVAPEKAAGKS